MDFYSEETEIRLVLDLDLYYGVTVDFVTKTTGFDKTEKFSKIYRTKTGFLIDFSYGVILLILSKVILFKRLTLQN